MSVRTFNLPDLGEGLPEAEIVKWHVSEGDQVEADAPLVSVETAKAVVDVPSPYSGRIAKLHAAEGDVVETGRPLVDFADAAADGGGADGDGADGGTVERSAQAVPGAAPAPATPAAAAPGEGPRPAAGAGAAASEVPAATAADGGGTAAARSDSGTVVGNVRSSDEVVTETAIAGRARRAARGRVKALPSVRAQASRLGISLAAVTPTGRNGQITQSDLERHAQHAAPAWPAGSAPGPAPAPAPGAEAPPLPPRPAESGPLRGPRRAMAQSMTRARNEVMECTIFDDAAIHAWPPGQDITVRILRAIAAGARAEPALNAWYDGEQMSRVVHAHVDVAMAVDGPAGLIVPVVRGVERRQAAELREDVDRLKVATRERSVSPEDMRDPTIMLSNFGMMAGRYATPVVVPPCVAILGTGGVRHDVVAVMGGIESHRRIPLSLTFDHRACTGGEACRFLAGVIADLALPA